MKKATLLSALSFVCLGSLSSCFTPVNLNFESSEMLKKGETEIQASGSMYNSDGDVATNFGVKLGTGLSERFNQKFRYE